MSDDDNKRWKCKYITGKNERIEIRRFMGSVNLVIFVWKNAYDGTIERPEWKYDMSKTQKEEYVKQYALWRKDRKKIHPEVKISMNGTMKLSFEEWKEVNQIVEEAREFLKG